MPSARVNPKDGSHLRYGQARLKWMKSARRQGPEEELESHAAPQVQLETGPEAGPSTLIPPTAESTPSTVVASEQENQPPPETAAPKEGGGGTYVATSDVTLSEEQRRVFATIQRGRNVFFTGPAGTGKSVLLREVIRWSRSRYGEQAVAVTASTGIAGLNVGGSTIHSWAGIGLGKEKQEQLLDKIMYSKKLAKRWRSAAMLIIDEISMTDGSLFDKLDFIGRNVRSNERSKPFGGIQLVLTGDFFQLPPVADQSHGYKQIEATYVFEAEQWSTCVDHTMLLQQVFRQTENEFIDLLSSIRVGQMTRKHIETMRSLQRSIEYPDGVQATRLFPRKYDVEKYNSDQLALLLGNEVTYNSTDSAGYDSVGDPIPDESAYRLLDRMIALEQVSLKVGAQVMLIQNIEQGRLVNGSTGKVIDFMTVHDALANEIRIAEIKSDRREEETRQRTKKQVEEDFTRLYEASGPRQLNQSTFGAKTLWPLVEFGSDRLLCAPVMFTAEGFTGSVEARRLQVPVILSWAISIHKSQGQTLSRVKVDLKSVFEDGQAYVALSRARSMNGLEIENFDPSKITVNERVLSWYKAAFDRQTETRVEDDIADEMDCEEARNSYWDSSF